MAWLSIFGVAIDSTGLRDPTPVLSKARVRALAARDRQLLAYCWLLTYRRRHSRAVAVR